MQEQIGLCTTVYCKLYISRGMTSSYKQMSCLLLYLEWLIFSCDIFHGAYMEETLMPADQINPTSQFPVCPNNYTLYRTALWPHHWS